MAAKKYIKHLFKVIDRFIIYLMLELDTGLVDVGEFNFDQSFLQFNVKKKLYAKSSS